MTNTKLTPMQEAAQQLLDATHHWQEVQRQAPPRSEYPPYKPVDPTAFLDWVDNQKLPARRAMYAAISHMQSMTIETVPAHPATIETYCAKWLDNA